MSKTYLEAADILWKTGTLLKLAKESSRRSTGFLKASVYVEELGEGFGSVVEADMEEWARVTDEAREAVLLLQAGESVPVYEELSERFGRDFADIMRLQGIGRVTALAIRESLEVGNLAELSKAVREGTLLEVKGVGQHLIEQLEEAIPVLEEELKGRAEQVRSLRAELGLGGVFAEGVAQAKALVEDLDEKSGGLLGTLRSGVEGVQKAVSREATTAKERMNEALAMAKEAIEDGVETVDDWTAKGAEAVKEVAEKEAELVKGWAEEGAKSAKKAANKGAKAVRETAGKGVKAVKETADKGVRAVKETADKGVKAVKETADKAVELERGLVAEFVVAKEELDKEVEALGEKIAREKELVEEEVKEVYSPAQVGSSQPALRSFATLLKCPETGSVGMELQEHEVVCRKGATRYPVLDGVVDMLGDGEAPSSALQRLMETPLYSRFYETVFRPQLTRLATRRSVKKDIALSVVQLRAKPDWAVLDIACGTGNYSRAIASQLDPQRGFTVGVDISWPMLKQAVQLKKRSGLSQLHFLRASAHSLPLEDGCMDAVHCAGALHLMPDLDQTLREMHRVVRPGGRMVLGAFLKTKWPVFHLLQDASSPLFGFHWYDQDDLIERIERVGFSVRQRHIDDLAMTVTAERFDA